MKRIIITLLLIIGLITILNANWKYYTVITDQMTNEKGYGAQSNPVYSLEPMEFPYSKTMCRVYLLNVNNYITIGLSFSSTPNILNTEYEHGYETFIVRAKFDNGSVFYLNASKSFGSKIIFIDFDDEYGKLNFINNLKTHNSLLIELEWYGCDNVYFKIDLTGSSNAINKMLKK